MRRARYYRIARRTRTRSVRRASFGFLGTLFSMMFLFRALGAFFKQA